MKLWRALMHWGHGGGGGGGLRSGWVLGSVDGIVGGDAGTTSCGWIAGHDDEAERTSGSSGIEFTLGGHAPEEGDRV